MVNKHGVCLAGVVLALAGVAQGAYLVNGNFETAAAAGDPVGQTFASWVESGDVAAVAGTAISGANSARMSKSTATGVSNSMYQTLVGSNLSSYIFDVDFATSDPGDANARSLHINLRPGTLSPTNGQINLRVVDVDNDGDGDVQTYNGSAWMTILKDAVVFSASESALNTNHLKIQAQLTGTPQYTLTVNSSTVSGVAYFHGAVPGSAVLQQVSFETGNLAAGAFYTVDNVIVSAVPEPAALGLIGLSGLFALRRRSR